MQRLRLQGSRRFCILGEDSGGDSIPSRRCSAGALCAGRNGVEVFPLLAKTMDDPFLTVNFNKILIFYLISGPSVLFPVCSS